jgi:hypothetical protein
MIAEFTRGGSSSLLLDVKNYSAFGARLTSPAEWPIHPWLIGISKGLLGLPRKPFVIS